MNAGLRFWGMALLLLGATISLQLMSHGDDVPPSRPLRTVPTVIGKWHATDIPLQPRVVAAAAADEYLSRAYRGTDADAVDLYIGYYKTQRTGESIHSPRNCLPGTGWMPVKADYASLPLPNGRQAAVNVYVVQKGIQYDVVVYWYQSHGRIVASEYWAKIYMVLDAVRLHRTDSALVRILVPARSDHESLDSARNVAMAFAEKLVRPLSDVIPR
jgi:EpsI family protein